MTGTLHVAVTRPGDVLTHAGATIKLESLLEAVQEMVAEELHVNPLVVSVEYIGGTIVASTLGAEVREVKRVRPEDLVVCGG